MSKNSTEKINTGCLDNKSSVKCTKKSGQDHENVFHVFAQMRIIPTLAKKDFKFYESYFSELFSESRRLL